MPHHGQVFVVFILESLLSLTYLIAVLVVLAKAKFPPASFAYDEPDTLLAPRDDDDISEPSPLAVSPPFYLPCSLYYIKS